ncbi:MAG: restriction endonuclease, partial [Clostridia bacterium]|nr:restriction endonuclease [Clostridia bacterium]
DMLVEKMGTIVAVSCVLTNKILGATDIQPVLEGQTHYPVSNAMVLTNMYFDRSALEFAKSNKISLVDRVILTEDFMN